MCGIAGYVGAPSLNAYGVVRRMLAAQRHRGPDGAGLWCPAGPPVFAAEPELLPNHPPAVASCVLGHNLLAIMDLSPGAFQPMASGPCTIAFNGEIYNFVELRAALEKEGEKFSTLSDTEVLLSLWRARGPAALDRLRGMFAFALHDARSGRIWLVRDPFGVKPLYYARRSDGLYFSSEIRALHVDGLVPRRLRESAVIACAGAGINKFGLQETLYEDILELPPGHFLQIEPDGRSILNEYAVWPRLSRDLHGEPAFAALRESFNGSVAMHLRGRRRIATCLSGGLDSTNLAWEINRQLKSSHRDFTAFTIHSGDDSNTELPAARELCRKATIRHREVAIVGEIPLADALEMTVAYESPNHVIGPINPFLLLRHIARSGATVVLDGLGGDELISGYSWYLPVLLRAIREGGGDAGMFESRFRERLVYPPETQARYEAMFHQPAAWVDAFVSNTDFLGISRQALLDLPETAWYLDGGGDWEPFRQKSFLRTELQYHLRITDRLGMWQGLECRVPFVDVEFNRVASRIKPESLLHDGYLKYPYRVLQPAIPERIRMETRKRGFWDTHESRFPWLREAASEICLESDLLRRLFPKLEERLPTLYFDPAWRLLQLAVLERCGTRGDLASYSASFKFQSQPEYFTAAAAGISGR